MADFEVQSKSLRKRVWLVTWLIRIVFSFTARVQLVVRVRVTGRQNVPARGGAIVCVNHRSIVDPPLMIGALRRNAAYLAKDDLFRGPLGRLLRWMGHIPVARGTESAREAAFAGEQVVHQGGLVVLHPEGACSPDDTLLPAKGGMAEMAFRTGAPVVPGGLVGTARVKPLKGWPRLMRRVEINFGKPILPPYQSDSAPLADRQAFTHLVMTEIARLSKQNLPAAA
jgi:1-acyl-sn-glycerol-3-phosphate acyltransferase